MEHSCNKLLHHEAAHHRRELALTDDLALQDFCVVIWRREAHTGRTHMMKTQPYSTAFPHSPTELGEGDRICAVLLNRSNKIKYMSM